MFVAIGHKQRSKYHLLLSCLRLYIDISEKLVCFYFKSLFKRNEIDLSSGIEFKINLLTEYNLNPFVV